MHASHQARLLKAGFTIYYGCMDAIHGLIINRKTAKNHHWTIYQKGFKSKAELKRRLAELDKKNDWIDLYDTKNTLK
ncbi:hypothetical protein [Sphingobacterium siyangense]|uniref:hypothetical protein n=2 Tax=Sphingobacterium siyangense TaxID=459529 RepID=UPI00301614B0